MQVAPSSCVLCSAKRSKDGGKKKYSDVVADSVEKAKSGQINFTSFRLRRRLRRERKFKCSEYKEEVDTMSALTKHIKKKHPQFKYRCKYCVKVFEMKNGWYKHMLLHKGKRFKCETCGKTFLWKCELRDHLRKHATKPAQRISCPVRGCKKPILQKEPYSVTEGMTTPLFLSLCAILFYLMVKSAARNAKAKPFTINTTHITTPQVLKLYVASSIHGRNKEMSAKRSAQNA